MKTAEQEASYDYMVAGLGLAGTVISHELIQRGKKVLLVDEPSLSCSSRVAAGLFNPVVFKRLVKSWMAEEQLACAGTFYTHLERMLGASFFHHKELVKIFVENQEKALWEKKRLEEVGKYLSPIHEDQKLDSSIVAPEGYAYVKEAGNLDVPLFLERSRTYFKSKVLLLEEKLNHALLSVSESGVSYKGHAAKRIIFCEGHLASINPWFNWMPFNLAKGEVLTIRIKGYSIEQVINKGVFILPLGNNTYRVGSTFSWDKLDEVPTEAGKADLVQRLEKVLKLPFEIIDHKAGIRPTVINRRPLIGVHPKHSPLCMFNGMGSKGVMIAPLFARHFISHLEEQVPLNPEVDIRRFYKN
ncbi:MAG TPA: FAD-dependent oxidoreductase [Bacteroidia bacterium]|jgi:glycine/D-amino acid oxidase-like deaminating enzyme|nr:FAD-dependent oxidoreductase [Bacteroidia bacterium]